MSNLYGYKVCYKVLGKDKIKVYIVTNTYDLALWHVRWYEKEPPKDKRSEPIINVTWLILPITSYLEYKRRYLGCPF